MDWVCIHNSWIPFVQRSETNVSSSISIYPLDRFMLIIRWRGTLWYGRRDPYIFLYLKVTHRLCRFLNFSNRVSLRAAVVTASSESIDWFAFSCRLVFLSKFHRVYRGLSFNAHKCDDIYFGIYFINLSRLRDHFLAGAVKTTSVKALFC